MRIPAYKNYKKGNEEWMPHIPSHWKLTRFQWIGSFESGKAHEPFVDVEGDFICVNSRFISTNGKVIKKCTKNITPAAPGDTLAVMSDLPNGRALARAFYVEQKDIYAVNQRVCRLSPGEEWPRFIYWLIDRNPGLLWFDDGFNQTHIPNSGYTKLAIALPPLKEQKSIASFLDRETAKIDALIAEQERLIELLQEKRQAVISHAVTKGINPNAPMKDSGVEWLGEVPEHWTGCRFKHCLIGLTDAEHKTCPDYSEGEYLIARTSNIRDGALLLDNAKYTDIHGYKKWTERCTPKAGDIIFTREAPAGEACIIPEGIAVCLGQRTVLMHPSLSKVTSEYLVSSIYSGAAKTFIQNLSQGSTVSHLNMSEIGNMPIALPPLEEQEHINTYIRCKSQKFDDLMEEAQTSTSLLQERRSALISAAVTGQIDVRGLVPEEEAA